MMMGTLMSERAQRMGLTDELISILHREGFRDPLYDAALGGRMSRAGLKLWFLQAALIVRQFPRFISAIHANCPYADAQELLVENLWEEHGRGIPGRDHFSLMKKLLRGLGAAEEEIERTEPLPETADYIAYCFEVTRERSFLEGMAAIGVGMEHSIPRFFGALARALIEHYGLTPDDVEFLSVHVEEDSDHSRRALEIIERYADSDQMREKVKLALREIIAIKRRFAEALYELCATSSLR